MSVVDLVVRKRGAGREPGCSIGGVLPPSIGGVVPPNIGGVVPPSIGGVVPPSVGGVAPSSEGGMTSFHLGFLFFFMGLQAQSEI